MPRKKFTSKKSTPAPRVTKPAAKVLINKINSMTNSKREAAVVSCGTRKSRSRAKTRPVSAPPAQRPLLLTKTQQKKHDENSRILTLYAELLLEQRKSPTLTQIKELGHLGWSTAKKFFDELSKGELL